MGQTGSAPASRPRRAPAVTGGRPFPASSPTGVPALAPGPELQRGRAAAPHVFTTTAPHDPVYDDPYRAPHEDRYGDIYGDPYGDGYEDEFGQARPATVFDGASAAVQPHEQHHPYGDLSDEDFEDDEEDERPRRGWTRLLIIVGTIIALLVGVLAAAGFWASRQVNPSGSPGESVTVELSEGMSTTDIAQTLADHDIISDARVFTFYARFRSKGDIQAGTYENLQTNMAMGDVLSVLAEGPDWGSDEATITPGQTVEEMMVLLGDRIEHFDEARLREVMASEVEFQYLPEGQENPEGLLAPGVYDLDDEVTEAAFLQGMADEFDRLYEELDIDQQATAMDIGGDVQLSGYDIVIVASMIERETNHDEEKPQIARVIYNRLAEDRALGIDATSCYLKEGPCHPLSEEDLAGPYSTREEPGLPPTPIASVSQSSLEAALNPADGDWSLYVLDVAKDDGTHFFTDDDDEWAQKRQACVDAGKCG